MTIDLSPIVGAWPFLAKALGVTVFVSLASMLLGLVLGLVVGAGRVYGGRALDLILGFYVDTMRAVPVLVVLVWTYFSFPLLIGHSVNAVTAGVAALGLHLAAYVAGDPRRPDLGPARPDAGGAGARHEPRAGGALDHPAAGADPHAPALGSLLVIAIKDSAIASVIAVPELMRQSQILAGQTFRPFEIYTCAMLVYFALCYPLARGSIGCTGASPTSARRDLRLGGGVEQPAAAPARRGDHRGPDRGHHGARRPRRAPARRAAHGAARPAAARGHGIRRVLPGRR